MLLMSLIILVIATQAQDSPPKAHGAAGGKHRRLKWTKGTIIRLRVPVSTESRHLMSAVTFPEKSIKALVGGWNETSISLDHKQGTLYVKLLKPAEGHLYVIGASGVKYTLYVTSVDSRETYDAELLIRKAVHERHTESLPSHRGKPLGSVSLIRSMRLGNEPKAGTVANGNGVTVFRTNRLHATLTYTYQTDSYSGYVLDLTNASNRIVHLDLSRLSAPRLVLIGAREMTVKPGTRTRLYVVFWKE